MNTQAAIDTARKNVTEKGLTASVQTVAAIVRTDEKAGTMTFLPLVQVEVDGAATVRYHWLDLNTKSKTTELDLVKAEYWRENRKALALGDLPKNMLAKLASPFRFSDEENDEVRRWVLAAIRKIIALRLN